MYCPKLTCPHRVRVRAPAEFLDHVARCSDCGTKLVASEADAIAGVHGPEQNPYRTSPHGTRDASLLTGLSTHERTKRLTILATGLAISLFFFRVSAQQGTAGVVFAFVPLAAVAFWLGASKARAAQTAPPSSEKR